MFKKIVSQLSFSPALVGQLGFYAKRLRKEQATRRIGLIFVALALVVQSLVVFQAPEPANASNANDMVVGGLGYGSNLSINNYLAPYDRNDRYLKDITNYFGITRAEIQNSRFGSFRVGSMKSYGFENRAGSTPISITNSNWQHVTTLYGRPLTIWGNSPNSYKDAFIGHSAKIGWFAILQDCGNIITPEYPKPPVKPQPANIVSGKSGINNTQGNVNATQRIARVNDQITYTVTVRNTGGTTGTATMSDDLSQVLKYSRLTNAGGGTLNGTTLNWPTVTLEPGKVVSKSYTVKMNSSLISTEACAMTNTFRGQQVTVKVDCKAPPANIVSSKSAVNVTQKNVNAATTVARENNTITYTVTASNTGGTAASVAFQDDLSEVMKYATLTDRGGATFNESTKILSWGKLTVNPGATITKTYTVKMKSSLESTSTNCQMKNDFLDKSVIIKVGCTLPPKPANITTSKKAINVTQKRVDATKATAKMGDVITYTITAKNTGGLPSSITMTDDLSDVLEFATLTDNGGGTFDKQAGSLSWGKVSVGAGKTVTKTYSVKMKPSLISAVLNCTIKNQFMNNTVTIPVACSTPPADIKPSKTAKNVSQGNVDATTVTAKENDHITFTLTAENVGGTAKSFTFTDSLSDALEYAKLINLGGGTYDEKTKTLNWPTIELKPGAKEVRTFTMQILSTIPATPTGLSDPSSYDCRIENTFFAASVMIPVSCAPPKIVENVSELPKTGATENMIFAGILFSIVTFFYLRSRQLGTEVRLIRRDINGGTI